VPLRHTLDLPARPTARGEFGDIAGVDVQIGDEAVVIGAFTRGVLDFDGDPGDGQRVIGGAQRHLGEPAVNRRGPPATDFLGPAMLFQRGAAAQIFGHGLVRRWLAGQDEAAAHLMDGLGDRLTGEEIVAPVDRPKLRHRWTVPGQPAFGGVPLTVLLLGSVPRGATNSGGSGRTRVWPGATMEAPRKL
jgi:hypothetical protein